MPIWAVILTIVFSGVAAAATVVGGVVHVRLAAKSSGRMEEKVDTLAREMALQREAVGECQTVEICRDNMAALNSRIDNAHTRMDRLERRIERFEAPAKA